jgi:hypothetical protein
MPSYKSNTKSVLGPLMKRLEGIQTKVLDKVTREIAADVVASNIGRIHNDGEAVDGTKIGDYATGSYKTKRQEKGKRIDKVDLSFTGKLSKEFSFAAVSKSEVGVGFLTDYGGNLHEALEEKYNKKIWGVTQEDERVAEELTKNRINKYLNV